MRDEILDEYTADHEQRLIGWVHAMITEPSTIGSVTSVMRYLGAIARTWVEVAPDIYLDDLDSEEWSELYSAIIKNSGDSQGTALTAIRNFHHFQSKVFEAPPVELLGGPTVEHIRARFVSPKLMANCLKTLRDAHIYNEKERLMLECMLVLAWRTGVRIGEVTALAMRDLSISGGERSESQRIDELLIRSNILGTIKTENANRRIPVFALLSRGEREKLDSVLRYRRSLGAGPNDPLFSPTGSEGPFPNHKVSTLFSKLRQQFRTAGIHSTRYVIRRYPHCV